MSIIERELNWVLDSPHFYSPLAHQLAEGQLMSEQTITLPGPIVHPNVFEYLDSAAMSAWVGGGTQRKHCADQIEKELVSLHTGRLGLVFEKYLEHILRQKYGGDQILTRVAVREDCPTGSGIKTWGEFDFLVHDSVRGRLEHWESSIKFYLQVRDVPDWQACWGPGVRDRLDLKGTKTFLQQLPLSSTELGFRAIPDRWSTFSLVKVVFAKGTIFYLWQPQQESFEERVSRIVAPIGLAPDHLKSWWIMPDSVHALRDRFPESKISVLPRRYWMTGLPNSLLEERLESWDEFLLCLESRLIELSGRRECMFLSLHAPQSPFTLQQMGFVASPHFVQAVRESGGGENV